MSEPVYLVATLAYMSRLATCRSCYAVCELVEFLASVACVISVWKLV
jgi:hypothetical protein